MPVAKGFITPTLIPFRKSKLPKPAEIVVFPISVSIPIMNTPLLFTVHY